MNRAYFYFTDEEYLTLVVDHDVAEQLKKKIQKDGFVGTVITHGEQLINCSLVREICFSNVAD